MQNAWVNKMRRTELRDINRAGTIVLNKSALSKNKEVVINRSRKANNNSALL